MKTTACWRAVALTFVLAACGGGGSDGADDSIDSTQPLAITGDNATAAAGLVADAALGGVTAASLGTVFVQADDGAATDGRAGVPLGPVVHRTVEVLRTVPLLTASGGVAVLQLPTTIDCTGDGTVSVVWDDQLPQGVLSVGDSVTLTFNSCIEDGLTLSGQVQTAVVSVTGDPVEAPSAGWVLELSMEFLDLRASNGGLSVGVAGSVLAAVSQAAGSDVLGLRVRIDGVLSFLEPDGFTDLKNYDVTFSENLVSGTFTVEGNGVIESSFGGRLSFTIVDTLAGVNADLNNPDSGTYRALGAGGSSVTVRVLNGVSVELDVDTDGDGTPDITLSRTWDDLFAAADAL